MSESNESLSYAERLKKHKRTVAFRVVVILVLVAAVVVGVLAYLWMKLYTDYDVANSTPYIDSGNTQFEAYAEGIVKYSENGVEYRDTQGRILWEQQYAMNSPIFAVCKETLALADQHGKDILVFGKEGLEGRFQTELPVLNMAVASQGVVAAVLDGGETTWINMYDKSGTLLMDYGTTLESVGGYPLDIALSEDGVKLMVSYLCMTEGSPKTELAFYNFGEVGGKEVNNLVSSKSYAGVVVPEVVFPSNDIAVAFRDDGFSIFKGAQKPVLLEEIKTQEEILSVFHDADYIGLVFRSKNADMKYRIELYDMKGASVLNKEIAIEYQNIQLENDCIVISNETQCAVCTVKGYMKFEGAFKQDVRALFPVNGSWNQYLLVYKNTIDRIILK